MSLVSLAAATDCAEKLLLFTIEIYMKHDIFRSETLTSKGGCISWIGNLFMKDGDGNKD